MKKFIVLDVGLVLFSNHEYRPLQSQELSHLRSLGSMIGVIGEGSKEEIHRVCQEIRLGHEAFFFPRHLDNCGRNKSDEDFFTALLKHVQDIEDVEQLGYGPRSLVYVGCNVTDYELALRTDLSFIAICAKVEDQAQLLQAGLSANKIICSFALKNKTLFQDFCQVLAQFD